MFFAFFGSMIIGGIVGYVSEKWGLTNNGYLASIFICLGGVFLFYIPLFVLLIIFGISFGPGIYGISFGSPGFDAILGSAGALIIVPTAWRRN